MEEALRRHGPFDGLMGFSQARPLGWAGQAFKAWFTGRPVLGPAGCARMQAALSWCIPCAPTLTHLVLAVQGGAMASLAIGMQRSGFAFKDTPPLRFCICFAGIRWGGTGLG